MKTSKDPRHQARRLALSIIYSQESGTGEGGLDSIAIENDLLNISKDNLEIDEYDKNLLTKIVEGVKIESDRLRTIIGENSVGWEIENIYKIDLSVLLISVWEILNTKTPVKVIIDEAVELAKEFGEGESPKFINGILAGVSKKYGERI